MPKKHVPSSRLIEIGSSETGEIEVHTHLEDYSTDKDEIEQSIADKFLANLNRKRKTSYVAYKSEHPDFICKHNGKEIALELMELVPRCVSLRKDSFLYTNKLGERIGKQKFHIEFSCPRRIHIPRPETKEGNILIEKILKSIFQTQSHNKEPHHENSREPLIPRDACRLVDSEFIRDTYPNLSMHYSLIGPVIGGVSYCISEEDYKDIQEKLREKLQKDYASSKKCKKFLLLYGFESARPDIARLANILGELMSTSPYYFSEVWYLRPYPNSLDDVRMVYIEND